MVLDRPHTSDGSSKHLFRGAQVCTSDAFRKRPSRKKRLCSHPKESSLGDFNALIDVPVYATNHSRKLLSEAIKQFRANAGNLTVVINCFQVSSIIPSAVRFYAGANVSDLGEPAFLTEAKTLADAGLINRAIDKIYAGIDKLLRTKELNTIRTALNCADPNLCDVDMCISLLSSTLHVAEEFPERLKLASSIRTKLIELSEDPDEALMGLI